MMRHAKAVGLGAALAALSHLAAAQVDDSHSVVAASLKRNMVGAAELDGQTVLDVRMNGTCSTTISTMKRTTTIDWSATENPSPQVVDGRYVVEIRHGEATDTVSMVPGAVAERVERSIGLLYLDCKPKE